MRICLLTNLLSHYRANIYSRMDREYGCSFLYGIEDSSVKTMDPSLLRSAEGLRNRHIFGTPVYFQKALLRKTSCYDVLVDDLGIMCLSSWMLLVAAKFRKQKVIHWDHGWYGRESFLKKILKRMYFGLADGALIYGDYAISLMAENGFDTSRFYPIHNSLDYDAQLELRDGLSASDVYHDRFGNSDPVLAMVGRLNERKHLDILLRAVSLLRRGGEPYNVVLIGDGSDRERLERIAVEEGIAESVWFYGACYDEKTNAGLLYNADACVIPGDVGLSAIHCMMFGVPLITHDCFPDQGPEFETVKEGRTGMFYHQGDVESLASAIRSWFGSDTYDRDTVRRACCQVVDSAWNPRYQMEIIKRALDEICKE